MLLLKPFCHFFFLPHGSGCSKLGPTCWWLKIACYMWVHWLILTLLKTWQGLRKTSNVLFHVAVLAKEANEIWPFSLNIPSFGQHSFSCLTEEVLPKTLISRAISWRIMAEGDPGKFFFWMMIYGGMWWWYVVVVVVVVVIPFVFCGLFWPSVPIFRRRSSVLGSLGKNHSDFLLPMGVSL